MRRLKVFGKRVMRDVVAGFSANLFMRDIFLTLILIDAALITLYLLFGFVSVAGFNFDPISVNLSYLYGLASVWNYGKLILISAILFMLWYRTKTSSFLYVASLFLVLLFDDYYELHDDWGVALGAQFSPELLKDFALQDKGEIAIYLGMTVLASLIIWKAWVSAPKQDLVFFAALTAGIVILGFFGVVLDIAHGVVKVATAGWNEVMQRGVEGAITVGEDGGEMLALSACLWLCLSRLQVASSR